MKGKRFEIVPHPFLESVVDLRDWYTPGTGESKSLILMQPDSARQIIVPPLPTPIVRMYQSFFYVGPLADVSVHVKVGAKATELLVGSLPRERMGGYVSFLPEPFTVLPGERMELALRHRGTEGPVSFFLMAAGVEGRPAA